MKGARLNELVEFRTKSQETQTAADMERLGKLKDGIVGEVEQRTNLTGGIRRLSDGGAAKADLDRIDGYLAERKAAIGGEETAKEFHERTDYGNTIDDFRKHQESLKKE
jgi:hypothetical protein